MGGVQIALPAKYGRPFAHWSPAPTFPLGFHRLFESILIQAKAVFKNEHPECPTRYVGNPLFFNNSRLNRSPPPFRLQFTLLNQFATRLS